MLWAIGSSIFVIYLYRTLNIPTTETTAASPTTSLKAELAALDSEITALEKKLSELPRGDSKK